MDRKLRIATIVTSHIVIPPPPGMVYASMDVAWELTRGLLKRGHEVTFYAPKGSRVPAGAHMITHEVTPLRVSREIRKYKDQFDEVTWGRILTLWDQVLIKEMFSAAQQGDYDLVHIHCNEQAQPIASLFPKVPTLYTLHDPLHAWRRDLFLSFASDNQWFVSISNAQRTPAPDLPYIATVYNGIDVSPIPFSDHPGSYLLFVGRIVPEKGVDVAIAVAQQLNMKLLIIGPRPRDTHYWDTAIEPHLNNQIVYVGALPREEIYPYYRDALVTLFPIDREEPFGLVMTESMATGTPVIAFRRGSVPEVIRDGKTGFIVRTREEMIKAVDKVKTISRQECREHVERHFGGDRMAMGYEQAYLAILEKQK